MSYGGGSVHVSLSAAVARDTLSGMTIRLILLFVLCIHFAGCETNSIKNPTTDEPVADNIPVAVESELSEQPTVSVTTTSPDTLAGTDSEMDDSQVPESTDDDSGNAMRQLRMHMLTCAADGTRH